jgi:hypothetical protein
MLKDCRPSERHKPHVACHFLLPFLKNRFIQAEEPSFNNGQALVEAKLDDKYASIRKATFGLVFFATPHHGGNFANVGDLAANIARSVLWNPKNTFMDNLKHNSIFSERLRDDFRHQLEDFKILSFYETKRLGPGLVR